MESTVQLTKEQVAELCHEVNRAYCRIIGDESQPPWPEAPEWQKASAIEGLKTTKQKHFLNNPAETSHNAWLEHKLRDGWRYGPVKDAEAKVHPCLLPYHSLPPEQQLKDHLFLAVAHICTNLCPELKPQEEKLYAVAERASH